MKENLKKLITKKALNPCEIDKGKLTNFTFSFKKYNREEQIYIDRKNLLSQNFEEENLKLEELKI